MSRNRSLVAWLLAISPTISHGLAWQTIKADEQPPETLIILQLGACERRCPVYNVVIFADGTGILDARHDVRQPGLARLNIGREALGKLLTEAESIKFFELANAYSPAVAGSGECANARSDAPAAVITISKRGKAKTILHYRGCAGADADKLKQFEDRIIDLANTGKRIK